MPENSEQTPAQTEGTEQTPAQSAETTNAEEETVTLKKSELTSKISHEVGKALRKSSKDIEALQNKVKEYEEKGLSDADKVLKDLEDTKKAKADLEAQIVARDLKEKKRAALEKANLGLPDGVGLSDVLDMMPGGEDDIEEQIKKFQKLWPAKKSLGTGTQNGTQNIKDKPVTEQVSDLVAKMRDPKVPSREKQKISEQIISLSNSQLLAQTK
jgi:hypothetical protein